MMHSDLLVTCVVFRNAPAPGDTLTTSINKNLRHTVVVLATFCFYFFCIETSGEDRQGQADLTKLSLV